MISMKSMQWIAADDPPAANSTVERIFDAIDRLGRFPLIGHKGRARDTFEWVVTESSHVIVYESRSRRATCWPSSAFSALPRKIADRRSLPGPAASSRSPSATKKSAPPSPCLDKIEGPRVRDPSFSPCVSTFAPRRRRRLRRRAAAVSRRRSNDCRSASC